MDQFLEILFRQETLFLIALGCSFAAAVCLWLFLTPDERERAARRVLDVVDDDERRPRRLLIRILRPALVSLGARFRQVRSQTVANYKKQRQKQLITANLAREMSPEEFIAFKIIMTVLTPLIIHYLVVILEGSLPPYLYVVFALVGFFAPELWLLELVKKRQRAIFRALPYTIDLLTLSVEAGLDFVAAIKRLATKSRSNPLIDELKILLNEISLGGTRSDALRALANRLQMEEINSFASLLIQADQLGASIGPVLRAQSDGLRTTRFQRAEVAGAKASQFILFPMIICIFPAIFIVVIGPMVVRFMTQGLGGIF